MCVVKIMSSQAFLSISTSTHPWIPLAPLEFTWDSWCLTKKNRWVKKSSNKTIMSNYWRLCVKTGLQETVLCRRVSCADKNKITASSIKSMHSQLMKVWISTLPETNQFAPENGWLEDDEVSFWGPAYFQGLLLAVSFREGKSWISDSADDVWEVKAIRLCVSLGGQRDQLTNSGWKMMAEKGADQGGRGARKFMKIWVIPMK